MSNHQEIKGNSHHSQESQGNIRTPYASEAKKSFNYLKVIEYLVYILLILAAAIYAPM